MEKTSPTQIKYNKTSCYFCNEWLDNDGFEKHLTKCGQVLEKCPNECMAFVQRKMLDGHLKECPKNQQHLEHYTDVNDFEQRMYMYEKDLAALRTALNEEIRQRNRLISDVGSIRKHNQIADEWTNKVGDVLSALKKCLNEETDSRCIDIQQCKIDINRIIVQFQQIENWRLEMFMRIENLDKQCSSGSNVMAHIDVLTSDARISAMKICNLEDDLEKFKLQTTKNKIDSSSTNGLFMEKLSVVDNILEDHHNAMSSASHDCIKKLSKLQTKVESNCTSLADIICRLATLDFELKSMKHIVTETEDKSDKLEKYVKETKQVTYKTKQKLGDLEVHLATQNKLSVIENCQGHLIWRIDDYSAKFNEAKENDITLRSPLFCNKQYGYTLRMDVNLNGIGTWKGRNIIACLTVVPGDWDTLLEWPCKLEADIILRDQPDNIQEAKNYLKTILVKKKQEKFEQNQFIHISHKTLNSNNYIKNDVIFFEIKINS